MEFDAITYNETNLIPRVNAKELRTKIINENPNKKFDIVLDIGCGTGNVTKELLKEFDINHIYAVDVDQELLNLAKENHPNEKVTYLRQDFDNQWDDLIPELKALEGKVSLVFTNFAINWIRNKSFLVANIYRFLAKGGKFYANILGVSDPYKDLPLDEKLVHERDFLKIPTLDEQLDIWTRLLEKNDLQVLYSNIYEKTMPYDREGTWPILVSSKLIYLIKNDKDTSEKAKNQLFDKGLSKLTTFVDQKTGRMFVDLNYQYLQISAEK